MNCQQACRVFCILVVAMAIVTGLNGRAVAADLPIEDFFGTYVGRVEANPDRDRERRDINVAVSKVKLGFKLDRTTIITKLDGRTKRSHEVIEFHRTDRKGIFISAVKMNMFGAMRAVDPLKGETYIWAAVRGDTLFTYAIVIGDKGALELQVREYTLDEGDIALRYYRFTEGWLRKAIDVRLNRAEG